VIFLMEAYSGFGLHISLSTDCVRVLTHAWYFVSS